jgi:hypothetical protein
MALTEREILLGLCKSLCIADHLGDAATDIAEALRLAGVDVGDDWGALNELYDRIPGKTLWGSE